MADKWLMYLVFHYASLTGTGMNHFECSAHVFDTLSGKKVCFLSLSTISTRPDRLITLTYGLLLNISWFYWKAFLVCITFNFQVASWKGTKKAGIHQDYWLEEQIKNVEIEKQEQKQTQPQKGCASPKKCFRLMMAICWCWNNYVTGSGNLEINRGRKKANKKQNWLNV